MYWFGMKESTGELVSAEERIFRNREGFISATMLPKGGKNVPFRSLRAAYKHIKDRETRRWDTETTFHIRRGLKFGYYITAHHAEGPLNRALNSKDRKRDNGFNVQYLVIGTPEHR